MRAKFITDWINDTIDKIIPNIDDEDNQLKSMETLLIMLFAIGISLFIVLILGFLVKYFTV